MSHDDYFPTPFEMMIKGFLAGPQAVQYIVLVPFAQPWMKIGSWESFPPGRVKNDKNM